MSWLRLRNIFCAAAVESILADCLVMTCPYPDHILSDGAEVGRIQRNRRARKARRGKIFSSTFHFTLGWELSSVQGSAPSTGLNQWSSSHFISCSCSPFPASAFRSSPASRSNPTSAAWGGRAGWTGTGGGGGTGSSARYLFGADGAAAFPSASASGANFSWSSCISSFCLAATFGCNGTKTGLR